jgi:hypothetical protein
VDPIPIVGAPAVPTPAQLVPTIHDPLVLPSQVKSPARLMDGINTAAAIQGKMPNGLVTMDLDFMGFC